MHFPQYNLPDLFLRYKLYHSLHYKWSLQYHTWDKMNTWSRIASVGVAGLAGVYVYSQVMNVIRTVTSIYDQIVNPMPSFDAAQAEGTAAA